MDSIPPQIAQPCDASPLPFRGRNYLVWLIFDLVCGLAAFCQFTTYIEESDDRAALLVWVATVAIAIVCSIHLLRSKHQGPNAVALFALALQGLMLFYVWGLLDRLLD